MHHVAALALCFDVDTLAVSDTYKALFHSQQQPCNVPCPYLMALYNTCGAVNRAAYKFLPQAGHDA